MTTDQVNGKWMEKKKALGIWKIADEERRNMILKKMPSYIGVIVIKDYVWRFLDCNNFKGINPVQKKDLTPFTDVGEPKWSGT